MPVGNGIATAAGSLGSDAVSTIVGLVIGAALGLVRSAVTGGIPARRAWRYKSAQNLVIVVATSGVTDTGVYHRAMTGLGQVRALSVLAPSLRRAYPKVDLQRVLLSEEIGGGDLDKDLLVIGGPKNNAVAKVLFERLSPRLPFTVEESKITHNGTEYTGIAMAGSITRDYGYVVRTTNPLHPQRRAVLIGGTHTYGTSCAARWLAENGGAYRVPANVAVLLEAEVVLSGHVSTPQVIYQARLK
jgi:hypothetical protein